MCNSERALVLFQAVTVLVVGLPVQGHEGILGTLNEWGQSCKSAVNRCLSSVKSSASDVNSWLPSASSIRSAPETPDTPVCPFCRNDWCEQDFMAEWPTCTHTIAQSPESTSSNLSDQGEGFRGLWDMNHSDPEHMEWSFNHFHFHTDSIISSAREELEQRMQESWDSHHIDSPPSRSHPTPLENANLGQPPSTVLGVL
ncbi:hypothetical protein PtA15_14A400 [Puccinia triticina]|uniref:Uncharacterized protein n=1 Tax=Puccinia triticina TaxID=208348 RepID=A0ABY7D292_9BASI|nr:uncharacterized protein PtA15_14A400 [Puccinia triticina]WAQ91516.1 hypothetical protein PtA15_14A400 [Puccinia triticina]